MTGIRFRIAVTAATVTVTLLSLVGALGYRALVDATRQSQIQLLNERLDEFEAQLVADDGLLVGRRQIDSSLRVVRSGSDLPPQFAETLQVVRTNPDPQIRAIVGVVDTGRIDATLATIRFALWTSVLVIGLLVGATAWMVVDRSLLPVRRLTRQAERNMASRSLEPLVVGDAHDEISQLANTFNAMLGRLRGADVDRRRFVSDASHELRTPLMVLQADAEFARTETSDPETAEFALNVLGQTGRLTSLVEDLLTLASLDETETAPTDVVTVGQVLKRADATVLVEELSADAAALTIPDVSRAVGNVVSNAVRYKVERVRVTVESRGDGVRFLIDDDGPGVPPAEQDQIFRRFYRPDHDRNRSGGGAGLGLAIARAELLLAGGSVRLEDSSLGGARFVLDVPLATNTAAA